MGRSGKLALVAAALLIIAAAYLLAALQ